MLFLGTSLEAEGKLRQWLATIPTSSAPDREWDDAQIAKIAEFAQEAGVDHLPAEDIYRHFVMHQVEMADMADMS